ncbi:MAG: DNA gyrase inhibitor YacG [Planctomycetes bacterium]|nr:DNA gyrase inhibitor YacG [Planctomycetota bacterium]
MVPEKEGQVKPHAAEKCRYCGRRLDPADPQHKRFWPFCCERCKMAELGLWFQDRYRISRAPDEVTDDAAAPPPKRPPGGRQVLR